MKIIADIDLAFYFSKGKSWLYSTIKNLKRERFEDDERILFRLDVPDIFAFSGSKGEIETYLDQLLVDFDIPDHFVIKSINDEQNIKVYQDTLCVLPWIHLYVSPSSGTIKPCCFASDTNETIIDYPTLDSAINSDSMRKIRSDMMQGRRPNSCASCFQREDAGLSSDRLRANQRWNNVNFSTEHDGSIIPDYRFFDIRLNNICNFKCMTCSHEFSSSIEQESKKLWGSDFHNVKVKHKNAYESFYKSVLSNVASIEKFYFAGGEPLLMEEHYEILDTLISLSNTQVELDYNTNMSNIYFKKRPITDYWSQFTNVNVGISLDGMGIQSEYIRNGSCWTSILENIKTIRSQSPHVHLSVSSTYSIYNCFHLMDFQKHMIENHIFDAADLDMHHAYGDLNTVHLLPRKLKDKLKDSIGRHISWLDDKKLISKWQECSSYLDQEDKSYLLGRFLSHVEILDSYRCLDLFSVFPELLDLKDHA